jgi:hypothetical protein
MVPRKPVALFPSDKKVSAPADNQVSEKWVKFAKRVVEITTATLAETSQMLLREFPVELILRFDTEREVLSGYVGKLPDYDWVTDPERVAKKIASNVHDFFFLPAVSAQLDAAKVLNSTFSQRLALDPEAAKEGASAQVNRHIELLQQQRGAPHLVRHNIIETTIWQINDQIKHDENGQLHAKYGMLINDVGAPESGRPPVKFPANSPLFTFALDVNDVYMADAIARANALIRNPVDIAIKRHEAWVALVRELAHSPQAKLQLFDFQRRYVRRAAKTKLTHGGGTG